MPPKEEKWDEMGFRTRINTLNALEQSILVMTMVLHTMALREGVHGRG